MARERPPWVGLDDERSATSDAPRVATESWHGDSVNDHLRRELAARGGESTTLRVSSVAAASVDAYIEYRRIVGDADGGQLFSDEEYARYRAAATAERSRNRLYVAWRNAAGLDCKGVGPATLCECGHRYKEHATDSLTGQKHPKDVHCRTPKCRCLHFTYLPSAGAWNAKCACKHTAMLHDPQTRACSAPRCSCACFAATFSCGCGEAWATHATVVQTRGERVAAGRPVDNLLGGSAGYEALGGITSFASLTDGATLSPVCGNSEGYASASAGLAAPDASDVVALDIPRAPAVLPPRAAAVAVQPPAAPPNRTSTLTSTKSGVSSGAVGGGGASALAKLKAARAASRAEAAASPEASPAAPPITEAQTYAAKRRAAAEHASALAAARRAAAAAAEEAEVANLSELDQLHRLSFRAGRR